MTFFQIRFQIFSFWEISKKNTNSATKYSINTKKIMTFMSLDSLNFPGVILLCEQKEYVSAVDTL